MRKPDFIGLGVRKAGTSWLYACLQEHPQICMPVKEADFFIRNFHKGCEWYESLFADCPLIWHSGYGPARTVLAGELSTSYFMYGGISALRIAKWYLEAKLFVCLRNPVERAFSDYKHYIMTGLIDRNVNFLSACERYPEIVTHGFYGRQLERWRKYHPRQNLLIILYDQIQTSPKIVIGTIYNFLGVHETFQPSMLYKRVNEGRIPRVQCLERPMLVFSHKLRALSHWLWWMIKKTGIGTYVKRLNARKSPPELTQTERRLLYLKYRRDIDKLEDLTGLDLEGWKVL